jgi:hypothetical protein
MLPETHLKICWWAYFAVSDHDLSKMAKGLILILTINTESYPKYKLKETFA